MKPCPFCGSDLNHVESWARSFDPPRLYHEYQHPPIDLTNLYCPLVGKTWSFTDEPNRRKHFLYGWNERYEEKRPSRLARIYSIVTGN